MSNSLSEKLRQRLESLRAEHAAGLEQQRGLQRRLDELNQVLLRIAGAIQVLEETLAEEDAKTAEPRP